MNGTISFCVLTLTLFIVSAAFAGTNYNCQYPVTVQLDGNLDDWVRTGFVGMFAAVAFMDYQKEVNVDLTMIHSALSIFVGVFGLRFTYSIYYTKLPKQFYFFVIIGIGLGVLTWYSGSAFPYIYLYGLVFITEILRVILIAIFRKKDGAWILGIGTLIVGVAVIYEQLMDLNILPIIKRINNPGYYSFLALLISMSVYLARNFAQTKKTLEKLNVELEDRVKHRTEELAEANQGLERRNIELRQTQNQLVQSEKMAALGNLVAGISHEVNNPIGAVNSAADVITRCINRITSILETSETVDDIKNNKQFQRSFKILQDNNQVTATAGDRIAKLVGSLKNFARLDEAEFQKADIHEGLDSTMTLIHHELKNKVEVLKEYGEIPNIFCYPNQLNQVFMNLFVNAAQAIEDKGVIKIKTSADDTNVYVEIADTGKGIPAEKLNRIFEPGFTTKSSGVGTGLGLSISYNIIQKHKGDITIKSEVGKGTEVVITLPIKQSSEVQNENGILCYPSGRLSDG